MKFDNSSLYNIASTHEGTRYSLFDLATWKNGFAFKQAHFSESGVPIIKIAELNNGIGSTTAYTQQVFSNEVHLKKGDLLFSWSGNPQTSIDIFRFSLEEGWLNQHIFKVTPKEELVTKDFFFFLMKYLKPHFTQIATNKQTTGLGHITIADIKRMSIIIPSLEMQKAIVAHIKPIDEKITLNMAINDNLEQQARALYQRMFIDNPVSGGYMGTLSDIADITMGQSPNGSSYNEDGNGAVFFQGRAEFGFRFPSVRLYTTEPKRMACANDTLMSVRAPVGDLNVAYTDCCIGRGLAAIHSKSNQQSFVLYTMFSIHKQFDVFNGEGTVFGSINRTSLTELPIFIPSDREIVKFEAIVAPIDAAIRNNYEEICRLEKIRDALLPKLISGELDVSAVEL
jgi:hypothetical protein